MLHLHHKHSLPIPHFQHSSRRMVLSPARSEQDELIGAIESDHAKNEAWQLDDGPDEAALDKYWKTVEDDIKKDPTWFNFADD